MFYVSMYVLLPDVAVKLHYFQHALCWGSVECSLYARHHPV